jgi:hypothetical protein
VHRDTPVPPKPEPRAMPPVVPGEPPDRRPAPTSYGQQNAISGDGIRRNGCRAGMIAQLPPRLKGEFWHVLHRGLNAKRRPVRSLLARPGAGEERDVTSRGCHSSWWYSACRRRVWRPSGSRSARHPPLQVGERDRDDPAGELCLFPVVVSSTGSFREAIG